jgi:hypothetical protein
VEVKKALRRHQSKCHHDDDRHEQMASDEQIGFPAALQISC